MNPFALEPLGDSALLIRLGDGIDIATNRSALALAATLRAAVLPGIRDIVPAYASVCVRYDIAVFASAAGRIATSAGAERVREIAARFLQANSAGTEAAAEDDTPVLEIPVRYGGEFGPDLGRRCKRRPASMNRPSSSAMQTAIIASPCSASCPDSVPSWPRRITADAKARSPRTRVPAGSVAIGGAQTGIYPRELPGGWQLIGRTPLVLFDPTREQPALLQPGQRVRFARSTRAASSRR
jgi:KipI family sensor histidine kinase inhibitor